MEINREALMKTYSKKRTDELLSLYNSGQLTPMACNVLEHVLTERGERLPEKPSRPDDDRIKGSVTGWNALMLKFLISFVIFSVARHLFYPIPNSVDVMPGSFKYIVVQLLGDSVTFLGFFVVFSIPIVIYWRFRRKSEKGSLLKLLNYALIGTIVLGGLMIYGGWRATNG